MSNQGQARPAVAATGVARFETNFRGWLEAAFANRFSILETDRKDEIAGQCYDLYNSSGGTRTRQANILNWTQIKGLHDFVRKGFQGGRATDNDFLHFQEAGVDEAVLLRYVFARVYVSFDHTNQRSVTAIANYLQRELKFKTRGILKFKIAGPQMAASRRDSAVIWVGKGAFQELQQVAPAAPGGDFRSRIRATLKNLQDMALTISRLAPLRRESVYGAGPLLENSDGVTFTMEPKDIPADNWKYAYNGNSGPVSYGGLMSCYLGRALSESRVSLVNFANKVAEHMVTDGIDPAMVYLLSDATKANPQ